jgi:hypothetical protein
MIRSLCKSAAVVALLVLSGASPSLRAGEDAWTGVDRVVAIGDVHGDYDQLVSVLRSASLIDESGTWTGGKAHLVQTGDIPDRGPDSRKALDLLMRLEEEAARAGGAVHALIGNHEAMNVYGDLRYVSAGEFEAFRDADSEKTRDALFRAQSPKIADAGRAAWDAEHPLGFAEHRRAFSPAGKYGRWILGHNAVIRIDDTLFLHGGLSPKYAAWGIRKINEEARRELSGGAPPEGGVVLDEAGPLWYRGLALGDEAAQEERLETLLKNYGVRRIVIGHTYTEGALIPRFGGRVIQIDVGLSRVYDERRRSACLVIEKGAPSALHRGKRLELPKDAGADLLRYLKEAAALDPAPSPLEARIRALEARLLLPADK